MEIKQDVKCSCGKSKTVMVEVNLTIKENNKPKKSKEKILL